MNLDLIHRQQGMLYKRAMSFKYQIEITYSDGTKIVDDFDSNPEARSFADWMTSGEYIDPDKIISVYLVTRENGDIVGVLAIKEVKL